MTPPSDPARLSPRSVAPLAIFLVSEQCRATHGVDSAAHGRYGRVFLGATQGWVCSDLSKVTVEEIAAHWERVEDRESYTEPLRVYTMRCWMLNRPAGSSQSESQTSRRLARRSASGRG